LQLYLIDPGGRKEKTSISRIRADPGGMPPRRAVSRKSLGKTQADVKKAHAPMKKPGSKSPTRTKNRNRIQKVGQRRVKGGKRRKGRLAYCPGGDRKRQAFSCFLAHTVKGNAFLRVERKKKKAPPRILSSTPIPTEGQRETMKEEAVFIYDLSF